MHALAIVRLIVLSTASIFGLVIMVLGAHLLSLTLESGFYYTFEALAVATGVMTIISLPILLIVGLLRNGAFISMLVVELPVIGFLSIMFLATGGQTAAGMFFSNGCDIIEEDVNERCREYYALEALSFVTWLALTIYAVVIVVYSSIASRRGQKVWTSSVDAVNFFGPHEKTSIEVPTTGKLDPFGTSQTVLPPPAQHIYPPGSDFNAVQNHPVLSASQGGYSTYPQV